MNSMNGSITSHNLKPQTKTECLSGVVIHTKISGPLPSTGPNSFVLTHIFTAQHLCQRSAPPPQTRVNASQWEILDPPLCGIHNVYSESLSSCVYLAAALLVSVAEGYIPCTRADPGFPIGQRGCVNLHWGGGSPTSDTGAFWQKCM